MYYEPDDNLWSVCSGNVDEVIRGKQRTLEQIVGHKFVRDTVDQGFSLCLPDVPCYANNDDEPPMNDPQVDLANMHVENAVSSRENQLLAQCHCGQVQLYIDRPDTGGKWEGAVCVCRSCRLSFGQTFVPFLANVPFKKIKWSDGKVFDDSAHSSITRYRSSEKAHRDFCSRCGASVLWSGQDEPGTIDIAAGILRSPDGALAKSWIDWSTKPCPFFDDAIDKELVSRFEANIARLS